MGKIKKKKKKKGKSQEDQHVSAKVYGLMYVS